jgi:hypothetical protein
MRKKTKKSQAEKNTEATGRRQHPKQIIKPIKKKKKK